VERSTTAGAAESAHGFPVALTSLSAGPRWWTRSPAS